MEWSTGDLVWFDPGVGHWLPGEVLECHKSANVLTVQAVINGKPQTFALTDGEGSVRRRQDLGPGGVEDMTQLSDLHEAALLWNLKLRYDRNLIYTYAGSILVAVNPYKMFDNCYGKESAQRYKGKMIGALPPHLFALGASAYAGLPAPQVVVISGESGSGKTESTKLVMQYLAAVAPSAPRGQALVTEQILEAAPLLEAFGNARTTRNDNSSRFGKYLEVYFKNGAIIGAKLTQYLLEKSRIVTQAPGERNYHVFYELLGGLNNTERQKYGLVDADKYFYLNQGGGDCAAGHSGSGADWGSLTRAMQVMGVGESEQEGILKVLASVLHLGNVYFHRRQLRHGQEGVEIGSDVEIKWAAHLLQISATGLQRALTSRITEARAERVYSPLSIDQALDARDAFAKALYAALFTWLVTRVNSIVQRGGLHDAARISLLDIFGFENLEENSFEQLCINFASESLQLYFNKHVFKLEQQEYARERLEWTNLTWTDNTPVIHLLGKKPVGILHLLDDESNFPKASDNSFLEKCHYNHALNENYCRPRVGGREFGIRHFAGQVWYSTDGFLDKNRDVLRPEVVELLSSSKEPLVAAIARPLFNQAQTRTLPRGANGRFVTMKPRTPTVAARFSDSLQQLLENMSRCNPWFIRCIKPNNEKTPMRFDMPVVLEQLRYLGMLDTIKIRQSGYPIRMKFQQFVDRYSYLLTGSLPRGAPYRDICRAIMGQIPSSNTEGPDYQLGATRVFLRESHQRQLEIARAECLKDAAVTIQKHIRGYLVRRKFKTYKISAITIQKYWRGYNQRKKHLIFRNGIVRIQALYRGKRERKRYTQRKAEYKRRVEAEKFAQERAKQRAAKEAEKAKEAREAQKATPKTTVHHLEIPAELAFIFTKLENYTPPHAERNLVKVLGGINGSPPQLILPQDLNQFEFAKFSSVYFKGADFGMKREPIIAPFLSKAAARDQDFQDAVALFKLILRWSNDPQLTGTRERALADYVVYKGLNSRGLRDELLVQLCNQAWKNENSDRIWQLMTHCLSCFQPSPPLSKYLLKFITDHATSNYKEVIQRKLTRGIQKAPHARSMPPSLLEWRSTRQRSNTALPLTLPDGAVSTVNVDSWTTCEEAAALAVNSLGIPPEGWSIVMDDAGVLTECSGFDYVLDLVSELELCPAFPVNKPQLLKSGIRRQSPVEHDHHATTPTTPTRPQVPPPEPPTHLPRKMSREASRQSPVIQIQTEHHVSASRKSSREIRPDYSPQRNSPVTTSTPTRKSSHDVLSRNSALNERYFDIEKVRSRSLDNLLSEPEPTPLADLGLSQSRLNDRYHSVEQLAPIKPVIANQNYMSKQEIEFEYPDISSVSTSNRGGPRYIKSQYAGKKAPPGSHSSKAQIERSSELGGVRSSAMSDTSEAPSLASHVRRVRVPSQASDVDQFLDELFSPVLDGNLDELSDARSLAASIKGGDADYSEEIDSEDYIDGLDDFLDDVLNSINNPSIEMSDPNLLVTKIKGGGHRNRANSQSSSILDQEVENITSSQNLERNNQVIPGNQASGNVDDYITDLFKPIFINESLKTLTEKHNLVDSIKGGGTTHQQNGTTSSSFNYPSMPTPIVSSPPLMLPLLGSPQESFLPLYNMPGMSLPPNGTDMAAYQQNLQRAFLQSAMAQNIQIQQQLLAQNQALQQLLTQQASGEVKVTETIQTTVKAQIHQETSPANRKQSFKQGNILNNRKVSSPSTNSSDYKSRKISSESNVSIISRNGVPPPPPMPPPIDGTDPSEARPFMDPYGRAKTVRIGKWRWPPPKGGTQNEDEDDFMRFKMRQFQRKVTPNKDQMIAITNGHSVTSTRTEQTSAEWEEIDFEPVVREPERSTKVHSKRAFEIGAARPSPGSVGKLKLSSEMRQRLEKVTANHSVRSTSSNADKPGRSVNKLEDARKMMLEQQLAGRWGDDTQDLPSGKSSPESPSPLHHMHNGTKSPIHNSWTSSNWKPGPPPPPIGPTFLPPAPPGPAPPPPVRPQQPPPPIEPIRDSYMTQRNDRDTFGVHQNRDSLALQNRESFSHQNRDSFSQQNRDSFPNQNRDTFQHQKREGFHQNRDGFLHQNRDSITRQNRDGFSHQNRDVFAHQNRDGFPHQNRDDFSHQNRDSFPHQNRDDFPHQNRDSFIQNRDSFSHQNKDDFPHKSKDGFMHQKRENFALQNRDSFIAQRQDRDTFGVHQNRGMQNNPKKNSFSGNWEVQSNLTQGTADDGINWSKEDVDKHDGRASRDSWDQNDSTTVTSNDQPRRMVNERWDVERKSYDKNKNLKEPSERPTFRTHQLNKIAQEREKKHSVASTQMTDKTERTEVQEWPEFMRPIHTPPSKSPVTVQLPKPQAPQQNTSEPRPQSPKAATRLLPLGSSACVTYNRVPWQLRVRKEVFTPAEPIGPHSSLHLIFCQISQDVYGITPCIRLTQNEKRAGVNMLSGYGVTAENYSGSHRANVKRNVVELAKTWPLYFARLFTVSGAAQLSEVQLVAVSHWGVHLVKREQSHLAVLKSFQLIEITSCTAPRPTTVSFDCPEGRLNLHTPRAQQLSEMVTRFCSENKKIQYKASVSPQRSAPAERGIDVPPSVKSNHVRESRSPPRNLERMERKERNERNDRIDRDREREEGAQSPSSPVPPSGKYSLMQFALQYFRQSPGLDMLKMDSSVKSKDKRKEWTWKQQTDLIKWQGTPIDGPLLKIEDPELAPLAVECFECILRYCGDMPLTPEMSEVKCVYTVLMHCHKYAALRDEVYCQLMKQTTSNKAESPESCQRAWRLLSIVAAYFACSDTLLPYLSEHLSSAASDRRRVCHGTAAVCLTNLRKTQRCGGRKNVPSVEEVTAVSAGRSARRQIYRLPGGAERVVNTRCSTVVADVISELCNLIGVSNEPEQQEFSLYCIVQGDAFTMPLAADEYILDVTTELHKAAQPFCLIFCRSVWYHPLKHDASPLYTEVLFNQVAPDYLEGLLLRLGNPNLPPSIVRDMALIAALLHRAADLSHSPTLKEIKFLLPKPVLGLREPRPPQWLALVQTSWGQAVSLPVSRAKHRVLQILSNWQLFGSSFFAVKRIVGDIDNWQEHILALNRSGVHFLDMTTHETLQHWPYAEVISTRKVRSEDGALFLDMKCGNLLQQRVTRLQTEQAHEISRLVRQYINLEQSNSNRNQ